MRFHVQGDRITVGGDEREQRVLADMLQQYTALVSARSEDPRRGEHLPADPALARLFPDPIRGDAEAAAELRFLIEPSLIRHKLGNAELVHESLTLAGQDRQGAAPGPVALAPHQELAWLKTLTDLRLVLAARLDIATDGDRGRSETDTDRWMQAAFAWLAAMQADLLDAIEARDAGRVQATDP